MSLINTLLNSSQASGGTGGVMEYGGGGEIQIRLHLYSDEPWK